MILLESDSNDNTIVMMIKIYACESCFSCDNDGICCDKCPCCDCNNVFFREITEKEWSSYINDHLNVSPGRKKKTSTNISARH